MKRRSDQYPENYHALVRQALLAKFGYSDMLTGETIPSFRAASFHHIEKDCDGGEYTEENGAMLNQSTHDFIHNKIENQSPETYELLMECLKLYKICLEHCSLEDHPDYYDELASQFEDEIQPKMLKLVKDSGYGDKKNRGRRR